MAATRLPEYERLDATGLAELVRRREVSPAELLEAAVERADAWNPRLNAIVNRFDAEARGRAAGPLPEGPFRGVPFLLKDLVAFHRGQPLTGSCRLFEGPVAPFDSEVVRRFLEAGLVPFGQTNTPELGILAVTESRMRGPCRNPWNLAHTPGGSSGGSAAAVAARIVPAAHGNDGGGSIRIPASCCGLFGMKPTRGRVSLAPAHGELWSGYVQEHGLTRSVRDSAALLDATAGNTRGDPYAAPAKARPFLAEVGAPPGRLRVAFTTESLFGRTTHPECAEAVREAASLLAELGHTVTEARPRFSRTEAVRAFLVVLAASTRSDLEAGARRVGRRLDRRLLELETWALAVAGRTLRADDLAAAQAFGQQLGREVASFFEDHDLLLTPTMAHPPARIGALALRPAERLALEAVTRLPFRKVIDRLIVSLAAHVFEATGNTMLFNQTGQPAASVPLHWNAAGLPIGVQLAARFGEEATLFRVAAQLEEAHSWADRRPPSPAVPMRGPNA